MARKKVTKKVVIKFWGTASADNVIFPLTFLSYFNNFKCLSKLTELNSLGIR